MTKKLNPNEFIRKARLTETFGGSIDPIQYVRDVIERDIKDTSVKILMKVFLDDPGWGQTANEVISTEDFGRDWDLNLFYNSDLTKLVVYGMADLTVPNEAATFATWVRAFDEQSTDGCRFEFYVDFPHVYVSFDVYCVPQMLPLVNKFGLDPNAGFSALRPGVNARQEIKDKWNAPTEPYAPNDFDKWYLNSMGIKEARQRRKAISEMADAAPPVNPPAQIQMASTQAPSWIHTPDTEKESGTVGNEDPNGLGDLMFQREMATREADRNLIKRAYYDAGLDPNLINSDRGINAIHQYYTDPETKVVYCRSFMPKATYQNLVLSLQQRKR